MSKLIVSCGTLCAGGAERVLSVLSPSFAERYDKVIYLTWIDKPDFYDIDKRVERICVEKECGSHSLLKKILWFRSWVLKQKPSTLLSFLEPFNMMICSVLWNTNIPLIVANRTDPRFACPSVWKRLLRWISYKRADGILFQTETSRNYFSNYIRRDSSVIYNPVFLPSNYIGKALSASKSNTIVTVGRLEEVKNQKMIIDAFKLFREVRSDYQLVIYGDGYLGKYLQDYIVSLDLESSVKLPGAVKDVWDRISAARCFVMTSHFEGMPNALIEAMCLGLPSISTPVAGASDLIEDGKNGLLVGRNEIDKLAMMFEQITSDEKYAHYLGNNATKLYDKLRLDVISQEWISYIDSKAKK